MSQPALTIGLPTFDDFNGVWFSVQALRIYHRDALSDCEILVVDNNPRSKHGDANRGFIAQWAANQVRYVEATDVVGTAASKGRVFQEAAGKYVLCIDGHVLIEPGAIAKLLKYYEEHPETRDLISGPMMYDNMVDMATHFDDVWRGEMWGIWATDPRGIKPDAAPFDIPGMGMGLFSCRREAWLGFNPHFRGFGGEEMYLHEKFRQAKARTLCLPFLRWYHRFGRPDGVRYPLTRQDKVRNYILGHLELGLPFKRLQQHFVVECKMADEEFKAILAEAAGLQPRKQSGGCCGGGNNDRTDLASLFVKAKQTPSDLNEHCLKLKELASQCEHVTEFGDRPYVSTVALLAGQPKQLHSYNSHPERIEELLRVGRHARGTQVHIAKSDSLDTTISETDLLFIDTEHTESRLTAELERHAEKVRHWIVLHDTATYGQHGEDGKDGLLVALRRFLQQSHEWSVVYHSQENHGLTVISRQSEDKPKLPTKLEMAANFAKAVANHVATGANTVDKPELERRLGICSLCQHRVDDRCTVCGCYIGKKAAWSDMECPLGMWDNVTAPQPA